MTKDELFKIHEEMCQSALTLMKKKNADYAGGVTDPFANFRRAEAPWYRDWETDRKSTRLNSSH